MPTPDDALLSKVRKTLAYHQRRAACAARYAIWPLVRGTEVRPVFIVGCSRAGTTLVYKTLSLAGELGSLQRETHDFWNDRLPIADRGWDSHAIPPALASAALRDEVSRYFYGQTGRFRFADKNNQNGLSVAFLQRLYPAASFVYVKRDPGDNVLSLIEGWRRPDEFATWSQQLPARVRIDGGRFDRWCFFLPEGWRDYLDKPIEDVCALQYQAMNAAILRDQALVPPAQWTAVHYEDIVRDPVAAFRDLYRHCDLAFGSGIEHHCATVLQKPYNAFSAIGVEKWRTSPDRDRILRVLPRLAEVGGQMGYRVDG